MPPAKPSLLDRFRRRRQRPSRPQEPADMGTAFGMEQCLSERDLPAAPRPHSLTRPPGWLARWLQPDPLRRARP
jgi:hypothetical protein